MPAYFPPTTSTFPQVIIQICWVEIVFVTPFVVDPVMLYSNGSVLTLQNTWLRPRDFKSGIVPFENLTKPEISGLEVVYMNWI
jgi:hypothetical protein